MRTLYTRTEKTHLYKYTFIHLFCILVILFAQAIKYVPKYSSTILTIISKHPQKNIKVEKFDFFFFEIANFLFFNKI